MNRPEDYTWRLFTDGSGHADGFGGCAWIAFCSAPQYRPIIGAAANSGTSVNRMELLAAVNGLSAIEQAMRRDEELDKQILKVLRPKVLWHCDRKSLVGAVTRLPMEALYGRDVDADLWAAFSVHEKRFEITATHVDRNKIPMQALCDRMAGLGRKATKSLQAQLIEIPAFKAVTKMPYE